MSYQELMIYCHILSIAVSFMLGGLITFGIYKICQRFSARSPRVKIVAEVCKASKPVHTKKQDKLFDDLINGKI